MNLAVGGSTEDESSSHPTVKSIENKNIASNNFREEIRYKRIAEKYKVDIVKEQTREDDELYGNLYKKIDKYLEKISKLPENEYYFALEKLINEYGRSSYEGENPDFIYCNVGSKQIICNHHKLMIDLILLRKKEKK